MQNQGRTTATFLIGFVVIMVLTLPSLVQAQDSTPVIVINPGNQTNAEGDVVSLQIEAAGGSPPLTYFAIGLPPGLSINSGTGLITGALGFDAAGEYASVVTVLDSANSGGQIAFLWTVTDATPPVVADVDCSSGGNIQNAVNAAGPGDTITFTGTCNEFVNIAMDGVTLKGVSPAIITEGVRVFGATRVVLETFAVSAGVGAFTNGVNITNGSSVQMNGVTVTGTRSGVNILRGSFARLDGNTFGPTVNPPPGGCAALCIFENSAALMTNNTVTGDSDDPLLGGPLAIFRDSSVTIRGGNTITNTGAQPAIHVLFNSSLRQDVALGGTTDTASGSTALGLFGSSYADLRQIEITGGIDVDLHSVLVFGRGAPVFGDPSLILVTGDIAVRKGSAAQFVSPLTTVNGAITCADLKSSLSLPPGGVAGSHTISCTDFDLKKVK